MDERHSNTHLRFRVPLSRHPSCIQALLLANEYARIENGWIEISISLTTLAQVQRAQAVADTLLPLSSQAAEAYGNEQRISLPRISGILACYAKSFGVSDYRAHCWVPHIRFLDDQTPLTFQVTDSQQPATMVKRLRFFPCQYASPSAHLITPTHPAPIRAQVEQALSTYECAWCPRLRDLDHWELLQAGQQDDTHE